MDALIKAENIVYTYHEDTATAIAHDREIPALQGVSVEIPRDKFTAIIGRNGSGKTTLSKVLAGMLRPQGGSAFVYPAEGGILRCDDEKDAFEIRKHIGVVFQNPDNQFVTTIVEDDVAFAPENLGMPPAEIRRRVDDALKTVGLSDYALHDTHKLSGGQKQRVAIAGILAMKPQCIIFDESTGMLDPRGRRDVMDTIDKLKEKHITSVLITHYMDEAAKADYVILLNDGKVVKTGTPREIFEDEELLSRCALDLPQSAKLMKTLAEQSVGTGKNVLNVDEAVEEIYRTWLERGERRA